MPAVVPLLNELFLLKHSLVDVLLVLLVLQLLAQLIIVRYIRTCAQTRRRRIQREAIHDQNASHLSRSGRTRKTI